VVWLEATYAPVLDAQGAVESYLKLAADITPQVEAEASQRARLNAINRAMAVIEFTPDGTVVDANDNFLATLGYRLEDIKGRHHRMFCDSQFAQSAEYQHHWQQLARGEFFTGQIKRIAKDGSVRWLEASYNPVFGTDGKTVTSVIKFASDITARVQAQRKESESARFAYGVPPSCRTPAQTPCAAMSAPLKTWPAASKKPGAMYRRWASARSRSPRLCRPSKTLPTRPICWP
jgi:methyl-accepting chemotaxis protein